MPHDALTPLFPRQGAQFLNSRLYSHLIYESSRQPTFENLCYQLATHFDVHHDALTRLYIFMANMERENVLWTGRGRGDPLCARERKLFI